MLTATSNSIFTNCAMTPDGDIWWEGMTEQKPAEVDGLAASPLDPVLEPQSGASKCALHHAREAVPSDRA